MQQVDHHLRLRYMNEQHRDLSTFQFDVSRRGITHFSQNSQTMNLNENTEKKNGVGCNLLARDHEFHT